jgi:hypothetical protein
VLLECSSPSPSTEQTTSHHGCSALSRTSPLQRADHSSPPVEGPDRGLLHFPRLTTARRRPPLPPTRRRASVDEADQLDATAAPPFPPPRGCREPTTIGAHSSTHPSGVWTRRLAAAGSRQPLAPTRQRIRRGSGRDARSTCARVHPIRSETVHRDYPHEEKLLLCPSSGGTPRVLRLILSPYSLDCWWSTSAHEPFDRSKWTAPVNFGV